MPDIWFLSDTHFGHANILKFTIGDGERLRPQFDSLEQMRDCIFDNWVAKVRPGDKVYHLGDVALGKVGLEHMLEMRRLPGKKRLVRGNHDLYDDKHYHDAGFQSIYGVRHINGLWLTHVPMHRGSLLDRHTWRRRKVNVHGHLHWGFVKRADGSGEADPLYYNVSVEAIGFEPVSLQQVRAWTRIDESDGEWG